jgi:hypothetical protein
MARATVTTPSNARVSKKTEEGTASKKRPASVTRARAVERGPSKRQAAPAARTTQKTRAPSRRRTSGESLPQSWGSLLNTLVTSSLGRAILADVLVAAADALRKDRPNLQQAVEDGAQQTAQAGAAAIDAGTDVASATVTLAQSAAGALAEMVTDATRDMLPGSTPGKTEGRGTGSRKRRRT